MLILNSQKASFNLRRVMNWDVEEFWVMGLTAGKSLIRMRCLFRGTVDACHFHPRDVIRFAALSNSSTILVAHNHPSDEPQPSPADVEITKQLYFAMKLVEIPLLDHIIVTRQEHYSFADHGFFSEIRQEPHLGFDLLHKPFVG